MEDELPHDPEKVIGSFFQEISAIFDAVKEKFTKKPKQDPDMADEDEDEDGEEPKKKKDLGMMVWKEADDTYRFIARYSNNLRDTDNPPEIISATSHERFVEMVEKKEVPLPEVWLWHIPEWRCGQVDWVTLDKQDDGTTFAIAGGHFFKEANWLAETLSEVGTVGVSHGMPKDSIERDPNDPSIIMAHITREISPLPQWAAANKWADFTALKENSMSIPDAKKQKLTQEWNLDPEKLAQLEAHNTETAGKAKEAGIESKETAPAETQPPEETPAPAEEAEEHKEETPVQPVAELTPELVTQLAAALKEVLTPVQADVAAIAGRMSALEDKVKELTEADAERLTKQVTTIPTASLGSLLVKSIIGETGTRVDGRTTLANSKPTLPADYKKEADAGGGILSGVVESIIAEHTHTTN